MIKKYIFILSLFLCWDQGLYANDRRVAKERLESLIKNYRTKRSSGKRTWLTLRQVEKKYRKYLSNTGKVRLIAFKAQLLDNAGYPILSSIYSTESIMLSKTPFDRESTVAWQILKETSDKQPIDFLVNKLALRIIDSESMPKPFGNDWNYHTALALSSSGKKKNAEAYLSKLTMKDKYFIPAQYHLAVAKVEAGKYDEAEVLFKSVLNKVPQSLSRLEREEKDLMVNYAHLALARLYYEQGKFLPAAIHYRKIEKDSFLYYDALFEQSWALFMGGRPKHALGSLYGVHSPYFKDRYNPESRILESMIYFWMCRYDEARNSLADFAEMHSATVEGLTSFLDRQRLTPEASYQLFENLISGVSSAAMGVSRKVLKTAAERDGMLLIRSQYAAVLEEYDLLKRRGVFGLKKSDELQETKLEELSVNIRRQIGELFLGELNYLSEHFTDLYTQAQFLYLELLMGQKEHLLGRELHADNKVRGNDNIKKFRKWSEKTQSWKDNKLEYWWDEIGYQIIDIESLCN